MKLSSFIIAAGFLSTLSAAVPAPPGLVFAEAGVVPLVGTRRVEARNPPPTATTIETVTTPTATMVEAITPRSPPPTATIMERSASIPGNWNFKLFKLHPMTLTGTRQPTPAAR
ncbi:hypothetical protein DBV05_g1820 [Lasiodiplodia theobromae]|uniref:Uncharacterized protein n=1 Tax=Lasiodiplodia theobromae TaxID=45133 RepID=A0A5N5DNW8_9PEZI|nr:hypothetical protein DBV05_g1820 [Lasiodiplodia theobromae]